MKMCKLSVKPLTLVAMLLVLIAIGGPASANARELRVVGSWSSLTLYNNFEKPFWTDMAKNMANPMNFTIKKFRKFG